jgi:hypothetical protein
MTAIAVPTIATTELKSEHTFSNSTLNIRLVGSAESIAKAALDGLLKNVHTEAQRLKLQEVIVDLRELEFMNSSCFKSFVYWLREAEELEPAKQYRIRLLSDDDKHWQRRSLAALACFAADLIRIET